MREKSLEEGLLSIFVAEVAEPWKPKAKENMESRRYVVDTNDQCQGHTHLGLIE